MKETRLHMTEDDANVSLLMNYRRMKSIKRCNNFPVQQKEDVAQHSYYTSVLAMAIADEYNIWATEHNLGFHPLDDENQKQEVNVEKLLRKALLHDTDEVFTSDIPWNIKHADEETHKVIEAAISKRVEAAYADTGELLQEYKQIARTCKEDFEGLVLNIADMLELAIYCYEEYTLGNAWMETLLNKALSLVKEYMIGTDFGVACPTLNRLIDILTHYEDKEQVSFLIDID